MLKILRVFNTLIVLIVLSAALFVFVCGLLPWAVLCGMHALGAHNRLWRSYDQSIEQRRF